MFTDPTTGLTYSHAEQYMMAQKASLFDDKEAFGKIMSADHPRKQQAIGRTIKNFDQKKWDDIKFAVVKNGNMLKFTQNIDLLVQLLDTGDRLFVEASPTDIIWGIEMKEDDPGVEDPNNWRGQNLLEAMWNEAYWEGSTDEALSNADENL